MKAAERWIRRHPGTVFAILVIAYAGALIAFASQRPIDADEGFYAAAARLASEGGVVYRDFFFPQTPALPHLYAPAFLSSSSLYGLRIFSALLGAAGLAVAGVLLVRRHRARPEVWIPALVLLAMDPYLASWSVTVKTHATTNLLLLLLLLLLDRAVDTERWPLHGGIGLVAALLVFTRLLYAPAVGACLAWYAWVLFSAPRSVPTSAPAGRRGTPLAACLAGLAVGLLPMLLLAALEPAATHFDNLGYHLGRVPLPPLSTRLVGTAGFFWDVVAARP